MEKQVVLYPQDTGSVAVITPIDPSIGILEIARKDTPAGKPFLIVNESDLPSDALFFNAWEADFSNPDGHGIGAEAWFAEQAAKETSE